MRLSKALDELMQKNNWVIYKTRERNGKKTKPPFQGKRPNEFAKSNDPKTWGDYATAVKAVEKLKEPGSGLGFVLTNANVVGIDLDKCRDPKTGEPLFRWTEEALALARELKAYVELSPSGTGYHIIGVGTGPKVDTKIEMPEGGSIEIYRKTDGRYLTMTGDEVSEGTTRLMNIDELVEKYNEKPERTADKDKSTSAIFHKYVLEQYTKKNMDAEEIVDEIRARPKKWAPTKAEEYDRKGRLLAEVERSIGKWQQENDDKAEQRTKKKSVRWFYGSTPGDSVADISLAIPELDIHLRYDSFHDEVLMDYSGKYKFFGVINDSHVAKIRDAITTEFGFEPGKDNTQDAVDRLALRNEFHPVLDYLNGLRWDGVQRLDKWVVTYLGVVDKPIFRIFGRKMLVGACRRVLEPGIKFDQICVLEGPEGIKKSSAIECLAGKENFSDQTILGLNDKEQQEVLRGVWLHEIADLKGMRHADTEHTKAFASRTVDRARPAYGRRTEKRPRQNVFFATTNDRQYLKGETGNRRWWPLPCGEINLKALKRDRDQLWAEAFHYAQEGESLELPREYWEEARQEQENRLPEDLLVEKLRNVTGVRWNDREERVATLTIVEDYLGFKGEGLTNSFLARRISTAMTRLGWEGPKPMRISHAGQGTQNGYRRRLSVEDVVQRLGKEDKRRS